MAEQRAVADQAPARFLGFRIILVQALVSVGLALFATFCIPCSKGGIRSLEVIENFPRSPSITYRADEASTLPAFSVIDASSSTTSVSEADTTAIILNWSRFPNVRCIASLLCSSTLHGVIQEVLIWNNNPRSLSYHDFENTTCPENQLRVYNSPQNLYFHARFLACSQATTKYCYIQDDDYLVLPEIVYTLHSRISEGPRRTIHLLPPHEHLTTDLRTMHTSDSKLHTSFAWLGHGAIMHRSQATEFLSLMRSLNASEGEHKMADNYFSLLSNAIPESWFDQGIELGGGQPFTVGTEGDLRNKRHILRAAEYLDSLIHCSDTSYRGDQPTPCKADLYSQDGALNLDEIISASAKRAPCYGRSCLLETNIAVLPDLISQNTSRALDILDLEQRNRKSLQNSEEENYLHHPPSFAVDGRWDTAFRSLHVARSGDFIDLDMLIDVQAYWFDIEMAWLIDPLTEDILSKCIFEMSSEGRTWERSASRLSCLDVVRSSDEGIIRLRECSVRMISPSLKPVRHFRARLEESLARHWVVHEVWMRGSLLTQK